MGIYVNWHHCKDFRGLPCKMRYSWSSLSGVKFHSWWILAKTWQYCHYPHDKTCQIRDRMLTWGDEVVCKETGKLMYHTWRETDRLERTFVYFTTCLWTINKECGCIVSVDGWVKYFYANGIFRIFSFKKNRIWNQKCWMKTLTCLLEVDYVH